MNKITACAKALVLIGLALGASACSDLSAIRKFTGVATDANQRFPSLAKDFTGSCLRRRALQIKRDNLKSPENLPKQLDAPLDENTENGNTNGHQSRCGFFTQDEARLIQANEALVNYLQTMGELAADDLTSY